ncbi:hypothetical protein ACHWQZ_G001612 [Mnemiopsis leidyi]
MKEYNIEIVGACGAGKSTFTIRLVQGIFVKNYDPTRQDLYRRKIVEQVTDHSQIQYTVNLLDTVGVTDKDKESPDFQDTRYLFGQGFVVVYDIANEASFEEAKSIMKEIITVKKDKKTPIMLVGNKLDLDGDRQVLRTSAVEESDKYGNCQFMEISCKDNTNVMESVQSLVKVVDKRTSGVVPKDNDGSCVVS